MEKINLSYNAGENVKWNSHFGKQFGSFFKNEIHTPGYKETNMNVSSSLIFNSKKTEKIKCPSKGEWLNYGTFIQQNPILGNKKE